MQLVRLMDTASILLDIGFKWKTNQILYEKPTVTINHKLLSNN